MNEKKQSGKKRLFLLVLVAFGIVLWITFTNLNRIALRHTLDETIGFVKIRLEQYETDAANDRVKSLVRLLDKTVSLGNEMTLKEGFGTQDLDSFAEEQRLTGALVLDENLNVVMQTTKGGSAMPLWEKLIDSPYVHNIVDYPKKTYSTRLDSEICVPYRHLSIRPAHGFLGHGPRCLAQTGTHHQQQLQPIYRLRHPAWHRHHGLHSFCTQLHA